MESRKAWIQILFALPLAIALLAVCLLPLVAESATAIVIGEPPPADGGTWVSRPKKGHLVQEPGTTEYYCVCNAPNPNCSPCWEWVPNAGGG